MFDFSLINIIDFVLVYIIIYYSLLAIRGTRATQVLMGLTIMGAVYVLAMRLGFVMVYELLDMFFSYSIVIFVILFQDDIKRMLAKLAQNKFINKENIAPQSILIEELTKACFFLAKKNLGALIVIEQKVGLNDLLEEGIKINAKINAELLTSIFAPQSPIHDGAVIIRKSQILGASVVLPLTKQELDPSFGTRHRAGLGLSDQSDAIVIIVSEEQREISIAHKGTMIRNLEAQKLKEKLYNLLPKEKTLITKDIEDIIK